MTTITHSDGDPEANPSRVAIPILGELYKGGRCLMGRGSLIDLMRDVDPHS